MTGPCHHHLDPDQAAAARADVASGATYTCPMHPEIRQGHPGNCPKCGMTLEPVLPELEEKENPELVGFQRRFWWTLPLTVIVTVLAMFGHHLGWFDMARQSWIELVLTLPVALWAGWPFFVRGAESIDQGSEHPLAAAITAAARDKGLALDKTEQFDSASGIGVRGTVAGKALAVGNATLMEQLEVDVSALAAQAEALRAQGASVMHLSVDTKLVTLVRGDLRGSDRARAVGRDGRQHETEPRVCLRLQRARRSARRWSAVPAYRLVVVADDRCACDEPELGVGDQRCPAVTRRRDPTRRCRQPRWPSRLRLADAKGLQARRRVAAVVVDAHHRARRP